MYTYTAGDDANAGRDATWQAGGTVALKIHPNSHTRYGACMCVGVWVVGGGELGACAMDHGGWHRDTMSQCQLVNVFDQFDHDGFVRVLETC